VLRGDRRHGPDRRVRVTGAKNSALKLMAAALLAAGPTTIEEVPTSSTSRS
jgi:UDP-N-acetylglucosamine enolpyruvyl transferase